MTEQTARQNDPERPTDLKQWRKPVADFLPVEETQTASSTGNDGNTPTTHS